MSCSSKAFRLNKLVHHYQKTRVFVHQERHKSSTKELTIFEISSKSVVFENISHNTNFATLILSKEKERMSKPEPSIFYKLFRK